MSDYKIITVSSHIPKEPYYCYDGFFKSLKRHGVEPVLLGNGEKFRGLATKPTPVLSYLKHGGCAGCRWVIFSDCWDVLFQDHPDIVIEKFRDFQCEVVINAENNCFPLVELKEEFDRLGRNGPPFAYPYLNSGFYIGNVDAVIHMLEATGCENPKEDYRDGAGWHHFEDQSPLQKVFLRLPNIAHMKLDTQAHICNTLGGAEMAHFDFTGDKIRNTLTGTTPSVWHANGGGKTTQVFETIRKRLGL